MSDRKRTSSAALLDTEGRGRRVDVEGRLADAANFIDHARDLENNTKAQVDAQNRQLLDPTQLDLRAVSQGLGYVSGLYRGTDPTKPPAYRLGQAAQNFPGVGLASTVGGAIGRRVRNSRGGNDTTRVVGNTRALAATQSAAASSLSNPLPPRTRATTSHVNVLPPLGTTLPNVATHDTATDRDNIPKNVKIPKRTNADIANLQAQRERLLNRDVQHNTDVQNHAIQDKYGKMNRDNPDARYANAFAASARNKALYQPTLVRDEIHSRNPSEHTRLIHTVPNNVVNSVREKTIPANVVQDYVSNSDGNSSPYEVQSEEGDRLLGSNYNDLTPAQADKLTTAKRQHLDKLAADYQDYDGDGTDSPTFRKFVLRLHKEGRLDESVVKHFGIDPKQPVSGSAEEEDRGVFLSDNEAMRKAAFGDSEPLHRQVQRKGAQEYLHNQGLDHNNQYLLEHTLPFSQHNGQLSIPSQTSTQRAFQNLIPENDKTSGEDLDSTSHSNTFIKRFNQGSDANYDLFKDEHQEVLGRLHNNTTVRTLTDNKQDRNAHDQGLLKDSLDLRLSPLERHRAATSYNASALHGQPEEEYRQAATESGINQYTTDRPGVLSRNTFPLRSGNVAGYDNKLIGTSTQVRNARKITDQFRSGLAHDNVNFFDAQTVPSAPAPNPQRVRVQARDASNVQGTEEEEEDDEEDDDDDDDDDSTLLRDTDQTRLASNDDSFHSQQPSGRSAGESFGQTTQGASLLSSPFGRQFRNTADSSGQDPSTASTESSSLLDFSRSTNATSAPSLYPTTPGIPRERTSIRTGDVPLRQAGFNFLSRPPPSRRKVEARDVQPDAEDDDDDDDDEETVPVNDTDASIRGIDRTRDDTANASTTDSSLLSTAPFSSSTPDSSLVSLNGSRPAGSLSTSFADRNFLDPEDEELLNNHLPAAFEREKAKEAQLAENLKPYVYTPEGKPIESPSVIARQKKGSDGLTIGNNIDPALLSSEYGVHADEEEDVRDPDITARLGKSIQEQRAEIERNNPDLSFTSGRTRGNEQSVRLLPQLNRPIRKPDLQDNTPAARVASVVNPSADLGDEKNYAPVNPADQYEYKVPRNQVYTNLAEFNGRNIAASGNASVVDYQALRKYPNAQEPTFRPVTHPRLDSSNAIARGRPGATDPIADFESRGEDTSVHNASLKPGDVDHVHFSGDNHVLINKEHEAALKEIPQAHLGLARFTSTQVDTANKPQSVAHYNPEAAVRYFQQVRGIDPPALVHTPDSDPVTNYYVRKGHSLATSYMAKLISEHDTLAKAYNAHGISLAPKDSEEYKDNAKQAGVKRLRLQQVKEQMARMESASPGVLQSGEDAVRNAYQDPANAKKAHDVLPQRLLGAGRSSAVTPTNPGRPQRLAPGQVPTVLTGQQPYYTGSGETPNPLRDRRRGNAQANAQEEERATRPTTAFREPVAEPSTPRPTRRLQVQPATAPAAASTPLPRQRRIQRDDLDASNNIPTRDTRDNLPSDARPQFIPPPSKSTAQASTTSGTHPTDTTTNEDEETEGDARSTTAPSARATNAPTSSTDTEDAAPAAGQGEGETASTGHSDVGGSIQATTQAVSAIANLGAASSQQPTDAAASKKPGDDDEQKEEAAVSNAVGGGGQLAQGLATEDPVSAALGGVQLATSLATLFTTPPQAYVPPAPVPTFGEPQPVSVTNVNNQANATLDDALSAV